MAVASTSLPHPSDPDEEGDTSIVYFLLIYDHELGEMVSEPQEFSDVDEANEAYEDAEDAYEGDRGRFEVLLVGSDSLHTVSLTHGLFFRDSLDEMDEFLASVE